MVAITTTFGAVLETYFKRGLNPSLVLTFSQYLLSFVFAFSAYRLKDANHTKPSWWSYVVFAICYFLLLSLLPIGNLIFHQHMEKQGVWLYKPDSQIKDCYGDRDCKVYHINQDGFRGKEIDCTKDSKTTLAIIGDSFIFGSGVQDNQTIAENLKNIFKQNNKDICVINGGMPGISLPRMLKIGNILSKKYDPDLFVLYLKNDDLSEVDTSTRISRSHNSFFYRMLINLNLELALEVFRLSDLTGMSRTYDPLTDLQEFRDKVLKDKKLFLVTKISGENNNRIADFVHNNDNMGWLDATSSRGWQQAETIKGDGHWNEKGNLTIAETLAPHIEDMFENKIHKSTLVEQNDSLEKNENNKKSAERTKLKLDGLKSAKYQIESAASGDNPLVTNIVITNQSMRKLHLRAYWCNESKYLIKSYKVCFSFDPAHNYSEDQIKWVEEIVSENDLLLKQISEEFSREK